MSRRAILTLGLSLTTAAIPATLILLGAFGRWSRPSPAGEKCSYCGMPITDVSLSAYMLVDGEVRYYDDLGCMLTHYLSLKGGLEPVHDVESANIVDVVVHDFKTGEVVKAEEAWFLVGTATPTPMRYGIVAFRDLGPALNHVEFHGGSVVGWDGLLEYFLRRPGVVVDSRHDHEAETYSGVLEIGLETITGSQFTLGEVARSGKPILLVFFATWCPTCSRNVSALSRIYQSLHGRVAVVLASFDPSETASEIESFLRRVNAPSEWLVAKPSLKLLQALHVVSQETVFLISPHGEMLYERRFGVFTEEQWLEVVLKHSHFHTSLPP